PRGRQGIESPGRIRRDGVPRGRGHPRRSPGDSGTAARRDDGVQPPASWKGSHVSGDGRAADTHYYGTPPADPRAPPRKARRHDREARSGMRDSHELISARGDAAEKALMGQVMERVRGRADGRLVSEVLHAHLEAQLKEKPKGRKKKG